MSLQVTPIIGFDQSSGLKTNKKPYLLAEKAFQKLFNAYVYRDRVRKRQGLEFVGRLRRVFVTESLGNSGASPWTFNIYSTITPAIIGEPNAQIEIGSVEITIGAIVFTDQGDGTLTSVTPGNSGTIIYVTGDVTLIHTAGAGIATTIDFNYFPCLPVMTISQREVASINFEQTVFFDTKYAYTWTGTAFDEFIPGTVWAGTDSDFYWTTNYRGGNAFERLFFVTNFVSTPTNPMRYTDGSAWTDFVPLVAAADSLFSARILISYYGRLLALNTWEGATASGSGSASNYFNRCRFSQIGNPIAVDAFRSDQFGKGGFLDAPTNEQIVNATFVNNTLIVFFERTTWQLRYVGEYGLPFIWERISSDLGSESTFSPILFSDGVLAIGDKAIISANATGVQRIDLDIPDEIFFFQNANEGVKRVQGIRDYKRELVFWNYPDSTVQSSPGTALTYPNRVLVYNYRNQTWAIFRDNVTAFGTFQDDNSITWSSTDIFWDDMVHTWDDEDDQTRFPFIISGNQQGFIHKYGYTFPDQSSLAITNVSTTSNLLYLTIPNHNLSIGEIISITGLQFVDKAVPPVPIATDLNNKIYKVQDVNEMSPDNIVLARWDFVSQSYYTDFAYIPDLATSTYIGGGLVTIYPAPEIQTKDFNPYIAQGLQTKLSYIDFLMGNTPPTNPVAITGATQTNPCIITSPNHGLISGQKITISNVQGMTQLNVGAFYVVTVINANSFFINIDATTYSAYTAGGAWNLLTPNVSVQLFINSSASISGNLLVGNTQLKTFNTPEFYGKPGDYSWFRFYATTQGQFFNVLLTYNEDLMNTAFTHTLDLTLNALTISTRSGGKNPF